MARVYKASSAVDQSAAYLQLLSEAVQKIGSSHNYERTLQDIADAIVPNFSDWCAVDILQENGRIKRLGVAHTKPEKVALAAELSEKFGPEPDAPVGTPKVIRTGMPEMANDITDAMLVAAAQNDEHLALMRALDMTSLLIVPVKAVSGTLGAITFVWAESRRNYSLADLAFAETLASAAGTAIENARLHSKLRK